MSGSPLSLDLAIEYLKGIGPQKGALLREQLQIENLGALIAYFPFRYIDKSRINAIADATQDGQFYQFKGILRGLEEKGFGRSKRLVSMLEDESGIIELIWFQNYQWILPKLEPGKEYLIFGRVNINGFLKSMAHPEIEAFDPGKASLKLRWEPVYSSTEKLSAKGLDSRGIRRIIAQALPQIDPRDITETLPGYILQKFKLPGRYDCLMQIHFPKTERELHLARQRLKFEELFFIQLRMVRSMSERKTKSQGFPLLQNQAAYLDFYENHLPFKLTAAQERVLKELAGDLGSGRQMNRLLQGDVGSGKTIIALLVMLMANASGFQCCLMAPTEVLAVQHYQSIQALLDQTPFQCALLTSNVKGKEREGILKGLQTGAIHILIGTHAVLEDPVQYQNFGLAVIDEQHRFGVEQRARLWKKTNGLPPHILVMTATPIPRTLAMSLYGDLDVSVIDELPPNRKPIKTLHFKEALRGQLYNFMESEIRSGRQVYIVFPLIDESDKLDLENLELGYEKLLEYFPLPKYQISVVHGRLRPKDKEAEMERFVKGITQIMVATTVIEVGVNVPNASIMVIENAERFGLSQLHQLRGRVGRGADQSYCVLMTADHLSADARSRIRIMCETQDGFVIAEEDLKIRGPGDLEGKQQSGLLQLKMADITLDQKILLAARKMAEAILGRDPELAHPLNAILKQQLERQDRELKLGLIS